MNHVYRIFAAVSAALLVYFTSMGETTPLVAGLYGSLALFFTGAILYFDRVYKHIAFERFFGLSLGLLGGLLAAYLLHELLAAAGMAIASPSASRLIYLIVVVFFAYTGAHYSRSNLQSSSLTESNSIKISHGLVPKVLDTSVIIDGRILDITQSGFIEGPFIIPNFVLREIQLISDSTDHIKRNRGRRGLEMLNKLQERSDLQVKISYRDYTDTSEVDAKLILICRELQAKLVTNDFNLSQVAELQGITVLNLNGLTNALKSIVLPGEDILINVIKEGKDEGQGVGYLDDGTMVVVENGETMVGKKARVNVISIIQTPSGKMIFTKAQEIVEEKPSEQENEFSQFNDRRARNKGGRPDRRSGQRIRR